MARIRTIKPEFFTSPTVAGLTVRARLTFIGLWTYVDDKGRGYDDARLVKAAVWPLDDDVTAPDVEDDLCELEKAGVVERWVDSKSSRSLLRVRSFGEHQRINRPTESRLPPSPQERNESSPEAHDALTASSPPEGKGSGREVEQGAEAEGSLDLTDDERLSAEDEGRRLIRQRRDKGEDIGIGKEQLIIGDALAAKRKAKATAVAGYVNWVRHVAIPQQLSREEVLDYCTAHSASPTQTRATLEAYAEQMTDASLGVRA